MLQPCCRLFSQHEAWVSCIRRVLSVLRHFLAVRHRGQIVNSGRRTPGQRPSDGPQIHPRSCARGLRARPILGPARSPGPRDGSGPNLESQLLDMASSVLPDGRGQPSPPIRSLFASDLPLPPERHSRRRGGPSGGRERGWAGGRPAEQREREREDGQAGVCV